MKAFQRILVNSTFAFLHFFGTISTHLIIVEGASNRSRTRSRKSRDRYQYSLLSQRSQQPRDPNPPPTIEDLEEQATTNVVIDVVLDQIIGVNGGIIVDRYIPSRVWLWRQWYSSVFSNSLRHACSKMVASVGVCYLLRRMIFGDWNIWQHPAAATTNSGPGTAVLEILDGFTKIWQYLLPLTTLVLTVFVAHAYNFWISVYLLCRNIQGRMSDIEMILSTHVSRNKHFLRRPFRVGPKQPLSSSYTSSAEKFLKDVTHKLRAFHVLFWASQARRFRILLTDRGLSRMVAKGILTQMEKESLDMRLDVPKTQKHWILLESIVLKCKEAQQQQDVGDRTSDNKKRKRGVVLEGGSGFEHILLDKFCSLRTSCNQITHKIAGRMPLAYAQYVQMLVDSFLFMIPLAQYNGMGVLMLVISVGMFTMFYSGLLDLAFDFLDPLLDDKEYKGDGSEIGDDNCCVYFDLAVLIRESSAAAQRWINAGSKFKT